MTGWRLGWLVVPEALVRAGREAGAEPLHLPVDRRAACGAGLFRARIDRRVRTPPHRVPRAPRLSGAGAERARPDGAGDARRRVLCLGRLLGAQRQQLGLLLRHDAPRPRRHHARAATSATMAASASCACRTRARWHNCTKRSTGSARCCCSGPEIGARTPTEWCADVTKASFQGHFGASTQWHWAKLPGVTDANTPPEPAPRDSEPAPLPSMPAELALWGDSDITAMQGPAAAFQTNAPNAQDEQMPDHRPHRPLCAEVQDSAKAAWARCTPRTTRCCRA